MTKMVITQKNFSKRELHRIISKYYHKEYTIRYIRGQIYVFFPNRDLEHSHVVSIANACKMEIISESFVRAVVGY